MKELRKTLVDIKVQMKELKLKVIEPIKVYDDFVEYHYFAHGYTGQMRFWDAAMKYEATRRLKELFKVTV